jgi:hypothetical protein
MAAKTTGSKRRDAAGPRRLQHRSSLFAPRTARPRGRAHVGSHLWLDRNDPFFAPVLLGAAYYHRRSASAAATSHERRLLRPAAVSVFSGALLRAHRRLGRRGEARADRARARTLFFTFKIGEHLADAPTGLVAASLAALYGPLFFFEAMLIPEALGVPLYAAGFYHCLRFLDAPTWRRGVLAGALLGLACLTKAGVILFVVLFSVILLLR